MPEPGSLPQTEAARSSRDLFEAEVRAAGIDVPEDYRARLFAMWEDHLPKREAMRTAALELPEEPTFTLKPTLPGGGGAPSGGQAGSAGGGL